MDSSKQSFVLHSLCNDILSMLEQEMQVLLATKRLLSLSILVLWGLDFCDFENDSDDESDLNINFVKFCLFHLGIY